MQFLSSVFPFSLCFLWQIFYLVYHSIFYLILPSHINSDLILFLTSIVLSCANSILHLFLILIFYLAFIHSFLYLILSPYAKPNLNSLSYLLPEKDQLYTLLKIQLNLSIIKLPERLKI